MSLAPGEARQQGVNESPKNVTKCRIPQKLPPTKSKPVSYKSKPANDAATRPKSANRIKDDSFSRTTYYVQRSVRLDRERNLPKRSTATSKKVVNDVKSGKAIITVPLSVVSQKHKYNSYYSELPDQETIKKREDLELEKGSFEVNLSPGLEESPGSADDPMTQKIHWQQYTTQFEQMKNDLGERQKAIMQLYATMRNAHQKMIAIGEHVILPPDDDLTIMNVSKLTPDQLLQMCAVGQANANDKENSALMKHYFSIDINKLYGLPSKIISTCEETLLKRKEIIDWFIAMKTEAKISTQCLQKKINEFMAENEMLRSSLEHAKEHFHKELNEIIDFMRKSLNEAVTLQQRTEEQTYQISELNSQNNDLRKQLHNIEIVRSHKSKLEELEKELREEKYLKNQLKDRLSRADGQLKIGSERASQLEAALEQSRSKVKTLERTLQQLEEQNQKMQADFDQELSKLTKSIQENTAHLEDIAKAREKLQAEKEDLEKRLGELSEYYNESLTTVKHDMNINIAKLIETEEKYEKELEQNKILSVKLESVTKQLHEHEKLSKELFTQIQEKEEQLCKALNYEKELLLANNNVSLARNDIENYKIQLVKKDDTIKLLERDLENSLRSKENLGAILKNKEEFITEVEKKQLLLEEQLQISGSKMTSYEQQLETLKNHIKQLQAQFGEFESLSELHDMFNQQRTKLLEVTRQNGELAQALQKKDLELKQNLEDIAEREQLLEQKEDVIKMLTDKEIEQNNIIKLLRTNLEIRTKGDMDLNQQILEKNSEIQTLVSNLDTRKKQIFQLEKNILTLEKQRKSDKDNITLLEKQIAATNDNHFDSKNLEVPPNNLDNIIKIFEEELGNSFDPQLSSKSDVYMLPRNKHIRERMQGLQNFEHHKENTNRTRYQNEHESIPTKIVMGNFVKKTYNISTNDDQFKVKNLARKKAITNIDTQKWVVPEIDDKIYVAPETDRITPVQTYLKNNNFLSRNLPLLNINQIRDEKKSKMFRLAGHRLQ